MKKLPYLRRKEILEILKQSDYVDLRNLSERFAVSYMTIHRDIEELRRSGEVLRVYGGAKMNAQPDGKNGQFLYPPLKVSTDLTIEERFNQAREFKQMIAGKAASFVKEGDIISLDPSTTTLHMCSHISHMNITVFTTSLMVALQFSSSPTVNVILAGGVLRKPSLSILSPGPQNSLLGVHMKTCFISAKALSFKEGLTDLTLEEPESKRLLAHHSERIVVLADHTKIGKVANYHVIDYRDMTAIITDTAGEMDDEQMNCLRQYREKGVEVIFSDEETVNRFQQEGERRA